MLSKSCRKLNFKLNRLQDHPNRTKNDRVTTNILQNLAKILHLVDGQIFTVFQSQLGHFWPDFHDFGVYST